ncbi:MAG: sulfite exporter TauE/SafE family protein [Candidatus Altiarchaeales archaeon]|nr:sulfite exporter TauE/SafE family protein [Candidatus Altiarchaeales archaeon]MBD3416414.1 sulfite exporter TauE/SafE family protein [Candidatus Altiarchaeales archaeon]
MKNSNINRRIAFSTADLKNVSVVLGVLAILAGGYYMLHESFGVYMPSLDSDTSIMLLFIIGLLTGFHCVAMCGGFVVSYSAKEAADGRINYGSHLTYGLSKTVSYAFFGAVFGFIGSFFTFTPFMRGAAAILAGLFLVLFGFNMLGMMKWFRRFRLTMPSFIDRWRSEKENESRSPAVIGLLNGLMIACGPLQAVYILAASSGSPVHGALYLAVFGLGTLPVLLGFGVLTSVVSSRMTHKIVRYSGVVVILLGLVMVNRGLALTGTGADFNTILVSAQAMEDDPGNLSLELEGGYQVIEMEVNRYGWKPDKFVLKRGVPVKWVIDGKEINGCNNAIQVPKLGLEFDIEPGLQTIEFTPDDSGTIPWSCWMGMIPGVFVVKEDINIEDPAAVAEAVETIEVPGGGSCGGSCGGGGCGCGCGGGR